MAAQSFAERDRVLLVANGIGLWITAVLVGWMYMFMLLGEIELFPLIPSIDVQIPGEARGWNMAHLEGVTNGLLLMAIAAIAPLLVLGARQRRWLFWSAVVTGWGFTVPAWANALAGTRGLAFDGGPFEGGIANSVIYLSGWPPVLAVHLVFALLVLGVIQKLKSLADA
ncbi:MAG: hypothetical protein E2O58_11975 [Gammaproteobacteria bacterium]|nr:MAG: hypothetical protein E2O75_07205 [Chloroflexota bacterium]TDJ22312.1 MAG: hypothetical protein E2O58_11975 [Gammaproteobacteria bacterium]